MLSARTARERRDSAARAGVRAGRKDWHRKIGSTSRERFGPFWVNGLPEWSGTRPLASGSARNDRRTAPIVIWATTAGASDMCSRRSAVQDRINGPDIPPGWRRV